MSTGASAEPLWFLGKTRRAVLQHALSERLDLWRRRWSTADDPIRVSIADAGESDGSRVAAGSAVVITGASTAHGEYLQLRSGWDFLGVLLGAGVAGIENAASTGSREIARELHGEVLRSLCTDLLKAGGVSDAVVKDQIGAGAFELNRSRSFAATVGFGVARATMSIAFNMRFAELLAPRAVPTPESNAALERRRTAIAAETVHVEALLGDVDVSLSELAKLSLGDVIVMDQALTAPGHLAMADGRRIARILLGSADAHRAVSVTK